MNLNVHSTSLFADDLVFPEAPRWQGNRLWISDVFDRKLYTFDRKGDRALVHDMPGRPSGIGFFPDGTLLVASSENRKLMKNVNGQLVVHADLQDFATGDVNDFVIDDSGRTYVGNFGSDLMKGAPAVPAQMHVVAPDGAIRVAADDLHFPNGAVLTQDGSTLIVAETLACRLTAFTRNAGGELADRRVYADLGHRKPDGICIDAEDGIWVACFNTGEFIRITRSGNFSDKLIFGGCSISCTLGGEGGNTLFCTTFYGKFREVLTHKRLGRIYQIDVDVPVMQHV
ncbi:Sugar lactone lactonase YvrE [Kushneria avicenniae]|uniref:Sugar lactone lactonase YvrE n=1 Tax=Kushneria avicenniae TaxID=402385 RepID=A0A1I1G740_9GAMM|nr:SMP-30/gluconolactonase/LRE family protein [Kushneria avicenniae]SFC05688.1 Sugar lactone lactonase YvrE [Kushneria avicenniae]